MVTLVYWYVLLFKWKWSANWRNRKQCNSTLHWNVEKVQPNSFETTEIAQTVRLWKHRWIIYRFKRKISSGIFKYFVRSSSYVNDCAFWTNGTSLWSFWICVQHKKFDQNDLMKCCIDLNIALPDASRSDIDPKDLCSEL